MNPALVQLAIELLPEAIALIKKEWAARHPTEPVPTDAEVFTAFQAAGVASLAEDDRDRQWLKDNPDPK